MVVMVVVVDIFLGKCKTKVFLFGRVEVFFVGSHAQRKHAKRKNIKNISWCLKGGGAGGRWRIEGSSALWQKKGLSSIDKGIHYFNKETDSAGGFCFFLNLRLNKSWLNCF